MSLDIHLDNNRPGPVYWTNTLNQTITYDHSTTGLLTRVTGIDPLQYVDMSYDDYDRVTSVTVFPQNYTIQTTYDLFERPVRITYPDGTTEEKVYERLDITGSKDRLNQWTQLLYSPVGDLHAVVNPAAETLQFDWCKCGALSRLVDAEGRITSFDYDLAGHLTYKQLPDGSSTSRKVGTRKVGTGKTFPLRKVKKSRDRQNFPPCAASIWPLVRTYLAEKSGQAKLFPLAQQASDYL